MADIYQFESPSAFLNHLQNSDEITRQSLVTELYSALLSQRSQSDDMRKRISSSKRENIQMSAVVQELRRNISLLHGKNAELLQKSAVDQFRLADTESKMSKLSKVSDSGIQTRGLGKSELLKSDEKFTGENKSSYPAFQRQIRMASTQNSNRYATLQSQVSPIYQNLGSGPR